MRTPRLDMSEWVTHFIHHRDPENDPDWIFGEGESVRFPYVYHDEKNERFEAWYASDGDYPRIVRKLIRCSGSGRTVVVP